MSDFRSCYQQSLLECKCKFENQSLVPDLRPETADVDQKGLSQHKDLITLDLSGLVNV